MKLLCAVLLISSSYAATSADMLPPALQGIGIEQRLGASVPLDATFRDEQGQPVRLGQYFGRRPVLLAFVYYRCPMLCTQILSGIVSGLRPISLVPGNDFDVIAISIDPEDTPATADAKLHEYARRYSRDAQEDGWHFLTGDAASIRAATEAAGFHYRFDAKSNMFLHASGVMILTPEGRFARYFYGVDYSPKDLKLSLIEASGNQIGSVVDQVLLFCYHYDPATGKYSAAILNAVRGGGILLLLFAAAALFVSHRRSRSATEHASP